MSESVWIVTEGVYSEYHIVAVFTDKDLLEKFMQIYEPGHDTKVELWDVNAPNVLNQDFHAYHVTVDIDSGEIEGSISAVRAGETLEKDEVFDLRPYLPVLVFHVNARDPDHARKIAADKWAQWRIEEESNTEA